MKMTFIVKDMLIKKANLIHLPKFTDNLIKVENNENSISNYHQIKLCNLAIVDYKTPSPLPVQLDDR